MSFLCKACEYKQSLQCNPAPLYLSEQHMQLQDLDEDRLAKCVAT